MTATFANKQETTNNILSLGKRIPCKKLAVSNILFPKWSDLGLLGMMLRQCVKTKEQPQGNIYDEAKFLMVMRVIGGKVLMAGRPDCYCWKLEKVENLKNKRFIGSNSAEGMKTASSVLQTITNDDERTLFADMLTALRKDLLLVETPEEDRICIEVTQELYDAGITFCIDSWMKPDKNELCSATQLFVGDFLIVEETNDGLSVYRIGRDEFLETHVI